MRSFPKTKATSSPTVQVSWGELLDKITILEIKQQRLKSEDAAANARRELEALINVAGGVLSSYRTLHRSNGS